jgi:hypothetical protein
MNLNLNFTSPRLFNKQTPLQVQSTFVKTVLQDFHTAHTEITNQFEFMADHLYTVEYISMILAVGLPQDFE